MDPGAFFHQERADKAFDNVKSLAAGVDRQNGPAGKAGKQNGNRDGEQPQHTAIKKEGDPGLAAGAHREIGKVDEGHQRLVAGQH